MSNIEVRKARKEDCSQIFKLIKELATYEKSADEITISLEEMIECGFGDKPVWQSLVAEMDNEMIGIALFYDRYSTWKGRRLYLEDLIITESMRGKGLGKQLLNELIEYAKKEKYKGMTWQVLDWNEPAIEFYKTYGVELDSGWLNANLDFN